MKFEYEITIDKQGERIAQLETRIKQWEAQAKRADEALKDLEEENDQLRAALEAIMSEEDFDVSRWSNETRAKVIHAPIFDDARQSALRQDEGVKSEKQTN